ncbi:MAG: hypothetical protein HY588_02505 [Candidatus Omnitrophica bacterium]|nr:hypothetical protein [Candidatus Omnitrophota bacterium]
MKKQAYLTVAFGLLVLTTGLAGCASLKDFPQYDQELIYDRPYDYTYLRTLEALNTLPGWNLEETDKVKGLIVLRNTQYGHLFDQDKWVARFQVKSLGRKQTSVSLEPASQRLEQGGELLKRIDDMMKLTAGTKGEKLSALVS